MIVYKLTNKINGKFYIGITTGDMKQRLRTHKQKSGVYLTSAMKKYGKENFIIEQIDTAKTNKELDEKEIYYISKLNPHYNLTNGGRTFFHHNEQTKKTLGILMSKTRKKYNTMGHFDKHTTKTREKISESLKGNKNKLGKKGPQKNKFEGKRKWLIGKNNPAKRPEVREKLRQAALRRYAPL